VREKPAITQDLVNELLLNPTKQVTEEQLRADYSYVVADIRSMAILALGLIVLLIVLATLLPR
jgi:type II secretory pathway component PulF